MEKTLTDGQKASFELLIQAAMKYGWEQGRRETPEPPDVLFVWDGDDPQWVMDRVTCSDRI